MHKLAHNCKAEKKTQKTHISFKKCKENPLVY